MARFLVALFLLGLALPATAQVVDPTPDVVDREGFVRPDEIVSFGPETPFDQFIRYVNPLFQRSRGKILVDPTGRVDPIGFYVTGLPYRDALDLVLSRAGLMLRETDRYVLIEPATGLPVAPGVALGGVRADEERVTAQDREVRIDAVIFEVNLNRVREIGTDWSSVFGSQTQQGGQQGGGQGGGGTNTTERLRLYLRTRSFFDAVAAVIDGPDRIDLAELNRIFRLLETNGVGRTVSTPSIVVRSGQEGRIQSGSDIPVTLRDFAGNTITQFISTGVIINAAPTVITDQDAVGNAIEFIHLDVNVERSSGRLSDVGITIDKNAGETDLLLVDGEQALLGGLYSTEFSNTRSGIPILKDIPLLGYFFGTRTTTRIERELILVLQATLLDPIQVRAARPSPRDLIDRERQGRSVRLNQTQSGFGDEVNPDE